MLRENIRRSRTGFRNGGDRIFFLRLVFLLFGSRSAFLFRPLFEKEEHNLHYFPFSLWKSKSGMKIPAHHLDFDLYIITFAESSFLRPSKRLLNDCSICGNFGIRKTRKWEVCIRVSILFRPIHQVSPDGQKSNFSLQVIETFPRKHKTASANTNTNCMKKEFFGRKQIPT